MFAHWEHACVSKVFIERNDDCSVLLGSGKDLDIRLAFQTDIHYVRDPPGRAPRAEPTGDLARHILV